MNVFIAVCTFFHRVSEGKITSIIFIPSSARSTFSLRPIDRDFLHHLQHKVNVIPVIAKADTLSKSELTALKKQLLSDIDKYAVQLYDFPEGDSEQDEESALDKTLRVKSKRRFFSIEFSFR